MKKIFLSGILFFLILLTTGCGKPTIIGKWKSLDKENEYYYIFNKDKSCSYQMTVARLDCTYEIDGEKINILFKGNENAITYWYRFDKGILVIKDHDGKDNSFIKKKK